MWKALSSSFLCQGMLSAGYPAYVAFINDTVYCLVNTERKSITRGNSTMLHFCFALPPDCVCLFSIIWTGFLEDRLS